MAKNRDKDVSPAKAEVLRVLSEELDSFKLSDDQLKVFSESRIFRERMRRVLEGLMFQFSFRR